MKRFLFFCAAMLAVMACNAQSVQIMKDGELFAEFYEKDGWEFIFKEKTQEPVDYNGHEYVDLGLPSGLKWATMNVGATTPEGYGDYFAWGETEPYYAEGHSLDSPCSNWRDNKSGYYYYSYKWCKGSYNTQIKYCTDAYYGAVDNKIVLDLEDDAAHVNWGGSWRMPTADELAELREHCEWTWTTLNGINGCCVTGPNGNSMFLPAGGYRWKEYLNGKDEYGIYCSSSLASGYSYVFLANYFEQDYCDSSMDDRVFGETVRAVCP